MAFSFVPENSAFLNSKTPIKGEPALAAVPLFGLGFAVDRLLRGHGFAVVPSI